MPPTSEFGGVVDAGRSLPKGMPAVKLDEPAVVAAGVRIWTSRDMSLLMAFVIAGKMLVYGQGRTGTPASVMSLAWAEGGIEASRHAYGAWCLGRCDLLHLGGRSMLRAGSVG